MKNNQNNNNLFLRDVKENDLLTFFSHQLDPVAAHMAAFTSKNASDETSFYEKWRKILNDNSIIPKTIVVDGDVAGHIARFELFEKPEISYWIGREYWGKGIATRALIVFLDNLMERPLHARVAKDNTGSIRVLKKCGFTITGSEMSFANARGEEIEEVLLKLK